MKDNSSPLTIANTAILLLMLFFIIGHGVSKGMIIDRMTPFFFWFWLISTPLVGSAALIASKKVGKRGFILLNGFILFLWVFGLMGSILLY